MEDGLTCWGEYVGAEAEGERGVCFEECRHGGGGGREEGLEDRGGEQAGESAIRVECVKALLDR